MPSALKNTNTKDFMVPDNLAQVADDTSSYAENIKSLCLKFEAILSNSAERCLISNIKPLAETKPPPLSPITHP